MTYPDPFHVLLVEDDAGDVLLVREALDEEDGRPTRVHVARDGAEALAFLRREGEHAGAPRPRLVLLDLNLPGVDGREVLARVKADESLRTIPVVVLTSSSADQDLLTSYGLHANAYVTKPVEPEDFIAAVRLVDGFYATVAKLPR
ncbi:response regulator [Saccharothrix syringae]|uniref:response regulator n=1 Tax=Saccharothrix syringae TaxID=103733 RepID=UPI0005265F51|nr:response regulator [Saccharothrix syringae]